MRRLLAIILLVALLFSNGPAAYADDVESEIEELEEEVAEYQEMLDMINRDIEERLERLDELDEDLVNIVREIEQNEVEMAEAQARLDQTTEKFGGRVRSAYINGGASYLEILLASESFGDLIIRLAYLTSILDRDAELIASIREEHHNIEQHQSALAELHSATEDSLYAMDAERRNLEEQRTTLAALLEASQADLEEAMTRLPQAERPPIYAVVFDNHPRARPQHGISQASTVYEFEVEGRITRYLVLFADLPTKVGPIRSAREHSIMLAWENNANYIYSSGSRDNLERIEEWGVPGTNALAHPAFYRDSSRSAPHNLYVNLATLNTGTPSTGTVLRPGTSSRRGTPANSISISYSPSYQVRYDYDTEHDAYRRLINGSPHMDAIGQPVLARNVIVQYTAHPTDRYSRTTPEVVGEGNIHYYVNGQRHNGTWKKDSPSSPTRFYYKDGQEIELVYGQTWINITRP